MKALTNLYLALDQTNKTNEKVAILSAFFREAPPKEKIWCLALLSGRRPRRQVKLTNLRAWATEKADIPTWLFNECHDHTGDLAETIALLLPPPEDQSQRTTAEWMEILSDLKGRSEAEQRSIILDAWDCLSPPERLVFNKLTTGAFRIGVSQTLVTRALSEVTGIEKDRLAHRLIGAWDPAHTTFEDLLASTTDTDSAISRPYPFCLAHALDKSPSDIGEINDWLIEWKWDGIRGQAIHRSEQFFLWSRGEELVTDQFPELRQLQTCLPDGTVLDGEILPWQSDRPLGFSVLQTRLGRKSLTQRILRETPVVFMAYDLLEWKGMDIRKKPLRERREILAASFGNLPCHPGSAPLLLISEGLAPKDWSAVENQRNQARENFAEGLMLKRLDSSYATGRPKGIWWKWKIDPLTIDAVLIQAQPGHGRRATLFTDYTFGIWDNDKLVPFAKAYSGLTDAEIRQVDDFVKKNTLAKHGPVRVVEPRLVFELGFENVALSKRHRAGIAVRFPRILRWRHDKIPVEADTLETLRSLASIPPPQSSGPIQLDLF